MGMAYVARDRTISVEPILHYLEYVELYLNHIRSVEAAEKVKNEPLLHSYQTWTCYNPYIYTSYMVVRVDGANVNYKSISEFKSALKYQISSIKRVYANVTLKYGTMTEGKSSGRDHSNEFSLTFGENGFKFEYDIDQNDKQLFDATNTFVSKIDSMPLKLDRIIRQKELVIMKVGFGMGLVPAIALGIISTFIPALHNFYQQYFVAFPFLVLACGFIFGIFLGGFRLSNAYSKLIPTKYGGYNAKTRSSYRVDDMDAFCEEVDVLMGKKSEYGKVREYISSNEKKFGKLILPELAVVLIASAIAFAIVNIF
ncbi:MAG: hypothetical protein MJ154_03145 [Candidatus Saccharibacteria bacterium]|nr:hypothetical protein [Candidatus Saccharibacteria bacterium]